VVGVVAADAIDKIKDLNLRIGTITEVQTGDRFVVKSQDPTSGKLTVVGDVVNITVGIPKLVRVPPLIDALEQIRPKDFSEAGAGLQKL